MAKNNKIQLFRTETSGSTTTSIEKGELALNINSNSPFIMFKDTSGTVQKLGSLSTSTGSSVFHTMTQKAITDALTARKNDTDVLATSLTAEITARKAVDGQSGQTYAANTGAKHISAATSLNDADIKLNNAITAETKARQDAIGALDATVSGNGTHVDVTVSQLNGKITGVSVAESDIASAAALTAEIAARKAVDGQSGQTYAANTGAKHISAATSLNDADIKLNNAITAETSNRDTAITNAINALDATKSGSTTHVSVKVVQTNGKLDSVTVTESDIASASALTAEITARKAVDGQTGQTYAKNTSAKYISAATSLNDADIKLNNAITAETSNRGTAITNAINAISGTTSGNGTHVDVTVAQKAGKITAVTVAESDIASASALTNLINWCAYMSGNTTSTNVTSIPTTKRLCIATISSSQTLGVNGTLTQGRELHIIVKNNATSRITITIPSTFKNLLDENLVIEAGKYGEINLVSDGSNIYYRGAS